MPPALLCTLNLPPVSAVSPSPRERALLGSSTSLRAELSSQSQALWPSCRILQAVNKAESDERSNSHTVLHSSISWFISRFLLWACPPVCLLTQLSASSWPSEIGCSSTPDPASLLTPVPPLSEPVAPAKSCDRKSLIRKFTEKYSYNIAIVSVNRITESWKNNQTTAVFKFFNFYFTGKRVRLPRLFPCFDLLLRRFDLMSICFKEALFHFFDWCKLQ